MENNKKLYSKHIGLRFKKTNIGVKFEDGVSYNNREMRMLQDKKKTSYKVIHEIKKMFKGVILK